MMELSSYQGLASTAADQLRKAIAWGSLKPGQRLVQEELAQSLGISREPIRQALRLLEAEGLVIQKPRRGAIVAPLSEVEVRNWYDVRAALDGMAARRTAGRLTPGHVKELRRLVAASPKLLHRGDGLRLLEADRAFHTLIHGVSGNQIGLGILSTHWHRIAAVKRVLLEGDYGYRAWAEHEAIVEALVAGDANRAERLSRLHIWGAADVVSAYLAEEATGPG